MTCKLNPSAKSFIPTFRVEIDKIVDDFVKNPNAINFLQQRPLLLKYPEVCVQAAITRFALNQHAKLLLESAYSVLQGASKINQLLAASPFAGEFILFQEVTKHPRPEIWDAFEAQRNHLKLPEEYLEVRRIVDWTIRSTHISNESEFLKHLYPIPSGNLTEMEKVMKVQPWFSRVQNCEKLYDTALKLISALGSDQESEEDKEDKVYPLIRRIFIAQPDLISEFHQILKKYYRDIPEDRSKSIDSYINRLGNNIRVLSVPNIKSQTFAALVQARHAQISACKFVQEFETNHPQLEIILNSHTIMKIAYLIEYHLYKGCEVPVCLEQHILISPRSIHIDAKQRLFALVADENAAVIPKIVRSMKRAVMCIIFPLDVGSKEPVRLGVRLSANPYASSLEDYSMFRRETRINERVRHIEGVMPLLSSVCDEKSKTLSMIYEYAHALSPHLRAHKEDLFPFAVQLINTISQLHKEKIVHNDINRSNILIQEDGKIGVIDFGLSIILNPEHNEKMVTAEIFNERYGSWYFTSPKHLAPLSLESDDEMLDESPEQRESWAVGCFLYDRYISYFGTRENDPWLELQDAIDKRGFDYCALTLEEQQTMRKEYENTFVKMREALSKVTKKTDEQHFLWTVCHLVHFSLRERWTMAIAADHLNRAR